MSQLTQATQHPARAAAPSATNTPVRPFVDMPGLPVDAPIDQTIALPLLIGLILVIFLLDFVIPGAMPKWAIFAPIFVPLFIRLGVEPEAVLAAYRVGDSPINTITPLMPYFALIVTFAERYAKKVGIGTLIATMVPYTVVAIVAWLVLFSVWQIAGIPWGF